jgi:AcrR family transcriptional regulator
MSKQDQHTEPSQESQQTRARIIAAAAKVLAEKGYEATTLREISREAQAAPGLVHYYFGGKDELLVEVLQAAGQQFHHRMQHFMQQLTGDQLLDTYLQQLYERVDQEPEVYRLRYESFSLGLHNPTIGPKVRERLAQRRDEIGSVVTALLQTMQNTQNKEHKINATVDPTTLAALLLSLYDGLALQKIMDSSFDLEAAYELLAQMLHHLLENA